MLLVCLAIGSFPASSSIIANRLISKAERHCINLFLEPFPVEDRESGHKLSLIAKIFLNQDLTIKLKRLRVGRFRIITRIHERLWSDLLVFVLRY